MRSTPHICPHATPTYFEFHLQVLFLQDLSKRGLTQFIANIVRFREKLGQAALRRDMHYFPAVLTFGKFDL